jgi:hypothetical protein
MRHKIQNVHEEAVTASFNTVTETSLWTYTTDNNTASFSLRSRKPRLTAFAQTTRHPLSAKVGANIADKRRSFARYIYVASGLQATESIILTINVIKLAAHPYSNEQTIAPASPRDNISAWTEKWEENIKHVEYCRWFRDLITASEEDFWTPHSLQMRSRFIYLVTSAGKTDACSQRLIRMGSRLHQYMTKSMEHGAPCHQVG